MGCFVSEHKKDFPEFYVTAPQPCPYLAGKMERKLFTHLTQEKPEFVVDNLLKGGFRRSQNIAYIPYCDACTRCVSVRIAVDDFVPSASFKRVYKRNNDLQAQRLAASATSEQYSVFRGYIDERHGDGGMADMSVLDYAMMVEDTVVDTFITEYRFRSLLDAQKSDELDPLIAVSLCDRLGDGISMVYSFFEPEMRGRSLGTYMILDHIDYARALGLPYVYLGYWIEDSKKMAYKQRFEPLEYLTSEGWVRR